MENDFKFSIIMSIYNVGEYLEEAVDSVINQTIGFEDNVQIILVNDGSTDNSEEICLEYKRKYPENIIAISKENGGLSSSRNCGLNYVTGEYVNFFDPDDILSEDTLEHVYKFFKEHESEIDFVAMPIIMFGRKKGNHILNYKFKEERVIDVIETPEFVHLSSASSFFKREVIIKYDFKEGLVRGEDALTINKLLLEKKKYGVVTGVTYWYRQRYDSTSMLGSAKSKESYYTPYIKDCFMDMIDYCLENEGYIPRFIQYAFVYDFRWLAAEKEFPDFYDENDIDEFWKAAFEFMSYIDDDVILDHPKIPQYLKLFLIYMKNKRDFRLNFNGNQVTVNSGDQQLSKLNNHKLWFDIITLNDGFLNISTTFKSVCDVKNIQIIAIKEELVKKEKTTYVGKFFEYPNRTPQRFLSTDWVFTYTAEFKIPIDPNDISRFIFKIKIFDENNNATLTGHIKFSRPCKLSKYNKYYINDNQIVSFENNSIYCKPYSKKRHTKYELKTFKTIFSERPKHYLSGILFRIIHLIANPFMKNRRIWLFSDRPTMADDSGMHLFKYAINQDDSVEKYYVVKKDCPDYEKMCEISKNILPLGSFKHKLYFSYAEKVITPYLNEVFSNPFSRLFRLFSGYFTFKFYFLQHGVTKDDISLQVKRYDKDLSLFLTSSDFERDSIFNGRYNYDEHVVQTLGLPRFDNLNNENTKKIILFMPTWRDYIRNETDLVNSEYFEVITNFLNNKKLINAMNAKGYTMVFKPHPGLMKYLEEGLFEADDDVIISIDDNYQELFNTSALLITDYSSVFFDFSYLKKPVIYYQVNEEEYHYEKGYFDYETMGFGKVTHDEETLIDVICEYMDNDCKNDEIYIERVENFFKYTDKNNCKRVYDWILQN